MGVFERVTTMQFWLVAPKEKISIKESESVDFPMTLFGPGEKSQKYGSKY